MDQSRKKSGDSHMWAIIKWLIVAVIVIVNLYADIKMYANGDLAYPLLDIILVGAGVSFLPISVCMPTAMLSRVWPACLRLLSSRLSTQYGLPSPTTQAIT